MSLSLEVVRNHPARGQSVLAELGPGEYFGEMALITDAPRIATVRTLTEVDALSLARTDFTTLYLFVPDLQKSVDNIMQSRQEAS